MGKPVLVLRQVTERLEGIHAKSAALVGTDPDTILAATERLIRNPEHYKLMSVPNMVYGDGHSSARILSKIEGYLSHGS